MTDAKKRTVRTAKPKKPNPTPVDSADTDSASTLHRVLHSADCADVRRAAVLHGMEMEQYLQFHTEGDAEGIIARGGCHTRHTG